MGNGKVDQCAADYLNRWRACRACLPSTCTRSELAARGRTLLRPPPAPAAPPRGCTVDQPQHVHIVDLVMLEADVKERPHQDSPSSCRATAEVTVPCRLAIAATNSTDSRSSW